MNKKTKIWLIAAASLIVMGGIIFGGVMTMLKWDFNKLSTTKYETNTFNIENDFSNISIKTDTADIILLSSENENCKVVCYEQANIKHSVEIKDGTLKININDTRKWYEHIGINIENPKITVYLPSGEYGDLSIKESTGDVKIPKDFTFKNIDISASTGDIKNYACASDIIEIKTSTGSIRVENVSDEALDLSVSTGNINASSVKCDGDIKANVTTGKTKLSDISCKNVTTKGSTGSILLKNVIASDKFFIERSTGDVKFESCDAGEIFIETDTGDVEGSLLSDKVFITQTDTGDIDIPKTTTGGRCEITTDTGDIEIKIK